jgi:hypothetical protein
VYDGHLSIPRVVPAPASRPFSRRGAGFHGLIAFDFDGDGVADASTWIGVGPDGEVPLQAQFRGPACRGLTNIGIYLEQCIGA